MSAPLAAEVLRELGAELRRFRSARHALLWYRDQLGIRLQVNRDLSAVTVRRSRAAIDQGNATFAAIARCLRRKHDADVEPESAEWLMAGERIVWLVAWYEQNWGDGQELADRAGLTRWSFMRMMRRCERVLAVRLRAAGLLVDA